VSTDSPRGHKALVPGSTLPTRAHHRCPTCSRRIHSYEVLGPLGEREGKGDEPAHQVYHERAHAKAAPVRGGHEHDAVHSKKSSVAMLLCLSD
jgi:hypothetical protein